MSDYRIPFAFGKAEFVEKHSRFIGRVWPAASVEEALIIINETKKKYWDATHNVYAYIIKKDCIARYSDDGEPQGTAGTPILEVLKREELFDVCCVVTRYFGGILLGAGGLLRAYSKAAKLAVDAAGIAAMKKFSGVNTEFYYNKLNQVKLICEDFGCIMEKTTYNANVFSYILIPEDKKQRFLEKLNELTSGSANIKEVKTEYRKQKI